MRNKSISKEDLLVFFKELSRIVNRNIPIDEALREISRGGEGMVPAISSQIEEQIKKGKQLSEALNALAGVSPYIVALIKSGETSGSITSSLDIVITHYRKSVIARKTIVEAMRYPAIIFTLFLIINVFFMNYLAPQIAKIYSRLGAELPPLSYVVFHVYGFFTHHLAYIILGLVILIILYNAFRKTYSGMLFETNLLMTLPVIGDTIVFDSLSRFCSALGILLKKNVRIENALLLASTSVECLITRKIFGQISAHISKGGKLSEGMRLTKLFTPTFVWMVAKAEERGDVEDTLLEIGKFYEERFDDYRGRIFTLLEPFLIILIGSVIGLYIISIFIPMFNIPKVLGGI